MRKAALILTVFVMARGIVWAELSVTGELSAIWDAFQYVKPAPGLLDNVDPRFSAEDRDGRLY